MKIASVPTSPSSVGKDRNPCAQAGTNFQQLVQQLEQRMWPGAEAGANDVQTLPKLNKAPIQQSRTQQQFPTLPAKDALLPTGAASMTIETTPDIEPISPSAMVQASPVTVPLFQAKQHNGEPTVSIAQPFFPPQMSIASSAIKTNTIEQNPVARMQPPNTSTASDGDRATLLPDTPMPTVVVRYSGSSDDLLQLKRALQDVLRRHGINDTALTINGFDALARIEHGAKHGR